MASGRRLAYDGGRTAPGCPRGDPAVPGSRPSIVDVGRGPAVADCPWPGAPAGPCTTRRPTCSTSTSPIHRRSSRSGGGPRIPGWSGSPPCPRRVRTVWTSISSAGGSSARVTPRCSLRWMPTAARCSAGRRSPGYPDVVFFNRKLQRLYVAIGDPGVIEVFDTSPLRRHETVATEGGAHTLSFDAGRNIICAFLPGGATAPRCTGITDSRTGAGDGRRAGKGRAGRHAIHGTNPLAVSC